MEHSDTAAAWNKLPVLTEIVDESTAVLPELAVQAVQQLPAAEVVEMSAEEIATLLAPQLEQQLREKLQAQFELVWQEAWQQARAGLPGLIRAQLGGGIASQGNDSAS